MLYISHAFFQYNTVTRVTWFYNKYTSRILFVKHLVFEKFYYPIAFDQWCSASIIMIIKPRIKKQMNLNLVIFCEAMANLVKSMSKYIILIECNKLLLPSPNKSTMDQNYLPNELKTCWNCIGVKKLVQGIMALKNKYK